MSVFNRAVVVIIAAVILAGAVITLLVAAGVSTPDVLPYGWFESQLQRVADATGGSVAGITAVSVAIALGMIALLFFEFIPLRRPVLLLISSTEKGVITIDVESVCVLAQKTAATVRSVRGVNCNVRESAEGLVISCRASVALGSNIVEVGADVRSNIKEAIEQLTGLPVAQVDIEIKHEAVQAKRLAVR